MKQANETRIEKKKTKKIWKTVAHAKRENNNKNMNTNKCMN